MMSGVGRDLSPFACLFFVGEKHYFPNLLFFLFLPVSLRPRPAARFVFFDVMAFGGS